MIGGGNQQEVDIAFFAGFTASEGPEDGGVHWHGRELPSLGAEQLEQTTTESGGVQNCGGEEMISVEPVEEALIRWLRRH